MFLRRLNWATDVGLWFTVKFEWLFGNNPATRPAALETLSKRGQRAVCSLCVPVPAFLPPAYGMGVLEEDAQEEEDIQENLERDVIHHFQPLHQLGQGEIPEKFEGGPMCHMQSSQFAQAHEVTRGTTAVQQPPDQHAPQTSLAGHTFASCQKEKVFSKVLRNTWRLLFTNM